MAAAYPLDRLRHAWAILQFLWGEREDAAQPAAPHPSRDTGAFKAELEAALEIRRKIAEEVYRSRAKDFHDPFRGITYRNQEEMEAVVGKAEGNSFITLNREKLGQFEAAVAGIIQRL
jgi:hypothetical protein